MLWSSWMEHGTSRVCSIGLINQQAHVSLAGSLQQHTYLGTNKEHHQTNPWYMHPESLSHLRPLTATYSHLRPQCWTMDLASKYQSNLNRR
jgi:hypothetical protein